MARIALILVPPTLLATTLPAFREFVAMAGLPLGYFLGFLFTWVVWCLLVPIVLAGTAGVRAMFRAPIHPCGRWGGSTG